MTARQEANTENIATAYIDYAKSKLGVKSDDELARILDVGKSTIASWRRRGSIPEDLYSDLLTSKEIDYFLFFDEYMTRRLSGSEIGDIVILSMAMIISKNLSTNEIADWAEWISEHRLDIFRFILKEENRTTIGEQITEEYAQKKILKIYRSILSKESVAANILYSARKLYDAGAA